MNDFYILICILFILYWISRPKKKKVKPKKEYKKTNGKLDHITNHDNAWGKPPKGYQRHHINGDIHDNRPKNLIALPPKLHAWATEYYFFNKKRPGRIRLRIMRFWWNYIKWFIKIKTNTGKNITKFNKK